MAASDKTSRIKAQAYKLGFAGIAVAKAEFMSEEASRLEAWLNKGYNGNMQYMENHFDKRVDPTLLVPGAKSVISLMYNYYTEEEQVADAPKLSMYAYGKDYHKVVKKKLIHLIKWMQQEYGKINGRCFVDSAPVLERDWAKRSGLGWVGKHTLLINKHKGSYFFLAEIISDLELAYDNPVKDHCGTCTKCINACPTDAISKEGYLIDGSKCISYLTIELKDEIPKEFSGHLADYIFGCDICQQVCPWNKFSSPHSEAKFNIKDELKNKSRSDWQELTEDTFDKLFEGSAVRRAKFSGLKRNIQFLDN